MLGLPRGTFSQQFKAYASGDRIRSTVYEQFYANPIENFFKCLFSGGIYALCVHLDYVELKPYTARIFFRLGVRDAAAHDRSGLASNPDQSGP